MAKDTFNFYLKHNDLANLEYYLNDPYYNDLYKKRYGGAKDNRDDFGALAQLKNQYRASVYKKNHK